MYGVKSLVQQMKQSLYSHTWMDTSILSMMMLRAYLFPWQLQKLSSTVDMNLTRLSGSASTEVKNGAFPAVNMTGPQALMKKS